MYCGFQLTFESEFFLMMLQKEPLQLEIASNDLAVLNNWLNENMITVKEYIQDNNFVNIELDVIRETMEESIKLCFKSGEKTVLTFAVDFKIEISFT